MATKVWTGANLVLYQATSAQPEFAVAAAAWSAVNGDSGTVTLTTSFVSGGSLLAVVGSLFDDGSVPPVITLDTVRLEFDWTVTNGPKAGGTTSSTIDFAGIDAQGAGTSSGHFDHSPPVGDVFLTPDRAGLFDVPTIGFGYYASYTGSFATHTRRIAVTNYTVTVTYTPAGSPITITPTTLPPPVGQVGYSQQLTATGGNGGPYTFSLVSGTLPAGLSLSSAGVLSGTSTNFAFAPTTLPNGLVDTAYSQQLAITTTTSTYAFMVRATDTAAGTGDQPYLVTVAWTTPDTFAVIGALPKCLTCTAAGLIAGMPMRVGLSTFTVRATDALGRTVSFLFTLTVTS